MTLSSFDPRETERFKYCCGGYRRWELIEAGGEWWWSLASDWGQAHLADVLMPVMARLTLRLDVSQVSNGVCPSHGTVQLCRRIRVGRLGVDGLPFRAESALSVTLERGRLRMGGDDLEEGGVWPLAERYWDQGPITLTLERSPTEVCVHIEGDEVARVNTKPASPALILLTANSAGAPEAGTRFGTLEVARR